MPHPEFNRHVLLDYGVLQGCRLDAALDRHFEHKPEGHLVHGDDAPKAAFCDRLVNEAALRTDVPACGQVLEI